MKLLIFGASGSTGHELVKQSLSLGHTVTAFVRDSSRLKINHKNLNLILGDITSNVELANVIKGHDVVLSALGATSPFKFDAIVVDGVGKIIKVMEELKVPRFIYLSFIGAGEGRIHGGFVIRHIASRILKTEIAGHEAREKMIRKSNLNWTIVQAPTLTNGKKKGTYRTDENLSSNSFVETISRADVADFMLSQCADLTFMHKTVRIMS
ncbi:MAG TPA: NAD(P)H-binding protein [Chryseolinea sp.]|nr:NAD(P)H-binding protein [Chryseolinea sp.]